MTMKNTIELEKQLLSPPGDTIQEEINFVGMSQAELAERMGRPKEKINDLIKGREALTTNTAFQLEKVLGIPAHFWLNREFTYRQELFALEQKEALEKQKSWLEKFPVAQLKKLGFLPQTTEKDILVDSLLKFFCVASPEEWRKIYLDKKVSVAFRVSLAQTQSPEALSTWIRLGEIQSGKLTLSEFDKSGFKSALLELVGKANSQSKINLREIQELIAASGVALVITPKITHASIKGSAHWHHNKPILQLSESLISKKSFWFTFFHEAGHIVLHGKKDVFLEDVAGAIVDMKKEEEANAFARGYLG
jgi:addiction module HigA family antidote